MNSYLKNISKERTTSSSLYSKDSEAYITGSEELTGSSSIKSKITSAYKKCVEYIARINKGYNQEIILESVDQATKENIYRYVKSLNLDLHEQREEGTETLVTIDITPLGRDQQGMHDLLVFLENEKLKLERKRERKRIPQCDIRDQHQMSTSPFAMPSMERVPSLSTSTLSFWHNCKSPSPSQDHDRPCSISSSPDNTAEPKLNFSNTYVYDAGAGDYQRMMEPAVDTKIEVPSPEIVYYRPLRLPKLKCFTPVETSSSMTQTSGTSIAISASAPQSEAKICKKRRSIFSYLRRRSQKIHIDDSSIDSELKQEESTIAESTIADTTCMSVKQSLSNETTGKLDDCSLEILSSFHTGEVKLAVLQRSLKMSGGNVRVSERTDSRGSVVIELDETMDPHADQNQIEDQQKTKTDKKTSATKKKSAPPKGDQEEEEDEEEGDEDEDDEDDRSTSVEDDSSSSSWTSSSSSSSSASGERKPDAMFTATVRTPGKGKRWSDQGLKQPAPRRYSSRSDSDCEDSLSKELVKQKTEIQEIKSTMEEMMKIIKDMRDNKFAR